MSRHVLLDSTWSRQQFLIFDCMYICTMKLLCYALLLIHMTNHEAVPIRPSPNEIKGFLKAHIQAVFCLRVFLEALEKQTYKQITVLLASDLVTNGKMRTPNYTVLFRTLCC